MGVKKAYYRAQAQTYWGLLKFTWSLQQWRLRILEQNRKGDQIWVHHYEPESKNWVWKHPGSPNSIFSGKGDAKCFGDSKGPILEDYLKKGFMINCVRYSTLQANNLKPQFALNTKAYCWCKFCGCMRIAFPYMASQIVETINQFFFEVLEHSAYNPDLTPSNYHLFRLLKDALQLHWFPMDNKVQEVCHKWLCDQNNLHVIGNIKSCRLLDQVHLQYRKMTYLLNPCSCVNKLKKKQECGGILPVHANWFLKL